MSALPHAAVSPRRQFGLAAVIGALAAGLLLPAASASASDTFSLVNDSKVATLIGTSLWGKGHTMPAKCRTGPFPGPTLTSFTFNPGGRGSITLSRNPFSKCLPGINPLIDNPLRSPYLSAGEWTWIPDDPFVGWASLTCELDNEYGSQPVEWSVDGLTCTISDPAPQSAGTFNSSAAPVRGRNAVVYVQHFPGSLSGAPEGSSSSGRYQLILRDRKGRVHGRTKTTIISGRARRVRVPISRALRKQVARRGHVKMKAVLRRVDGKPGSGDRTVLTVMKDHPSLPF